MNWMNQMNAVIDYVEGNLRGEIDMKEVERIAQCSIHNYQRMFSYIANQSLATYIRNRRLTLAAYDIMSSDDSILDVAMRYGYSSNEAFSRAFQKFHGVLPSQIRKRRVQLTSIPKISFQLITKGDVEMKYSIEDWPAFEAAGFKEELRAEDAFKVIPKMWDDSLVDGRFQRLMDICMQADMRPSGVLGITEGDVASVEGDLNYYLSVTTYVDVEECEKFEVPEDIEIITIPAAKWVIINADGSVPEAVQNVYKTFYSQWLPSSGYKMADLPVIECYMQNEHQEVWIAIE